jgi:hypothetical protein
MTWVTLVGSEKQRLQGHVQTFPLVVEAVGVDLG